MKKSLSFILFLLPFSALFSFAQQEQMPGTEEISTMVQKMRDDGASEEVMRQNIEAFKKDFLRRQSSAYQEALKKITPPLPFSSCVNSDIGVENGTFAGTGWQGFTGSVSSGPSVTVNPSLLPVNNGTYFIRVVPPPTNASCLNNPSDIPLPAPVAGNLYSIQLGDYFLINAMVERVQYTFVVQPSDTNFIYSYAVVMENPGHSPADQPFLEFLIYDQFNNVIPCSYQKFVSGPGLPGFISSTTCPGVLYKPWTIAGVNLSQYVGQPVTVQATNVDCVLTGHWAVSYLDFFCGVLPATQQFCMGMGDTVILCAPNEPGFAYTWCTGQTASCITLISTAQPDTLCCYVSHPSGCGYWLSYILQPTIINPGFVYTVNGDSVYFTDTSAIIGGTLTGWNWSFQGGAPSSSTLQNPGPIIYPPGTYTVCLITTSQAGCTDTVCQTIVVPPVSVNETEFLSSILISSNPSSGELLLDFGKNNFGRAALSVSNVLGQLIFKTTISTGGKQLLFLPKTEKGIYFVQVRTAFGEVMKKIVAGQ